MHDAMIVPDTIGNREKGIQVQHQGTCIQDILSLFQLVPCGFEPKIFPQKKRIFQSGILYTVYLNFALAAKGFTV